MHNRRPSETYAKQMRRLEHAGFEKHQVDALIDVIGWQVHAAVSAAMSNLATKDDLTNFVTKDDLHKAINQILRWVPAVIFGTILTMATVVTLIIKFVM